MEMVKNQPLRVCVVGAGKRFLSGISYYTLHLINALANVDSVSTILMRQLLPTRLYPGRKRVGMNLTCLPYDSSVRVFDGIDWYWIPSLFRSLKFLKKEHADVVVFQWWSGTVLHSYLALALMARLFQSKVVIEFHEVIDTGEASLPLAHAYVRLVAPLVVNLAHGFVIHSEYDEQLLRSRYNLGERPVALIPHGPYDGYQMNGGSYDDRVAPLSCCNLLYFGVIRPYKGLEDLIIAFNTLPESEIQKYWLTIVGETWEGWILPSKLISESKYRDRITFVNRYVSDEEVSRFFDEADAVVLPYHRSSTSGPLNIAMSYGLPLVVTRVGGLIEAVSSYSGAILVPAENPEALQNALVDVAQMRGIRFTNAYSWEHTVQRYHRLFDTMNKQSKPGVSAPTVGVVS